MQYLPLYIFIYLFIIIIIILLLVLLMGLSEVFYDVKNNISLDYIKFQPTSLASNKNDHCTHTNLHLKQLPPILSKSLTTAVIYELFLWSTRLLRVHHKRIKNGHRKLKTDVIV